MKHKSKHELSISYGRIKYRVRSSVKQSEYKKGKKMKRSRAWNFARWILKLIWFK
jgi:hypothetical protein